MPILDPSGHPLDSTPLTDEQLISLMAHELNALTVPAIMVLQPGDLFRIVGLLQLASRHPQLDRSNRETIRDIITTAREYFAECPTVLDVIRRGGNPREDR